MSPLTRTLRLLSLAWLGALATPLAARVVPVAGPDSLAPAAAAPAAAAEDPAPGLKLSGYAEASYTYGTQPDNGTNVGRLFDKNHDAFVFNAFKLTADKPFDAKKLSVGGHADVLLGQNAPLIQADLGAFNLGTNGDLEQAYVVLNFPTSNGGVQIKAGKMVTLLGLEVIETVANPNWSVGNQFNFVENLTSTGFELDFRLSTAVDVELRVDNGWDRTSITNGYKSFMGRVGIVGSTMSLGLIGYAGNQEDTNAVRYGVQALLNKKLGKASLWIQGDYGMEQANDVLPDPTQDATWWGLGVWLATDVSPTTNLALRADYVDDTNGFRTNNFLGFPASTGEQQTLWSLTGTLNMKAWAGGLVRPEVRYDHSNLDVFNGEASQFTGALSVAFLF
jgi:hypothetical protein